MLSTGVGQGPYPRLDRKGQRNMAAYIFVGLIQAAMWLFVLSPGFLLAYCTYSLVVNSKAAGQKVSPAVKSLREARQMIKFARNYRAMGCERAANEAIRSALNFRRAAHAHWYYGE